MINVQEFRGHIRNWKALCEELNIDITLERTARENAILTKAYEKWGTEMALHMHGMFAFALWDDEKEQLFCLRDPFGTKPFYYYITKDNTFLCGTTIRAIMEQPGFVKELNEDLLQIYLTLTYVPDEDTFFKGLKKFSSLIFQRPEIPGKKPHLLPLPNFVLPSARKVTSNEYLEPIE